MKETQYLSHVKRMCNEAALLQINRMLNELEEYFRQREKSGYPRVKTQQDIHNEVVVEPLLNDCLKYLKNELANKDEEE